MKVALVKKLQKTLCPITGKGVEVVRDDRDERPEDKFPDA